MQRGPNQTPDNPSTEPAVEGKDKAALSRRNVRAAIASALLILGFGWLLQAGGLPLLPPEGALEKVDVGYLVAFAVLMVVHFVTRFARCHFLIAPLAQLSMRRLMVINAISMALITLLPLRLGELARPAMLREKGHLSFGAVTGTVAAERILDGVVYSVMLLTGLALAIPQDPLPDKIGSLSVPVALVPHAARVGALAFGCAFVVMATFYWHRAFARRLTERTVGLVSVRLAERVAGIVERLSDGLRFLINPRYTVPYLGVTLFSIASLVLGVAVLARAVGISELTIGQASVVLGLVALGFALPNAPGFFGTVQLTLYAGLAVYIAPEKVAHEGAALVFFFYVTHLGVILTLAATAMVVEYFAPIDMVPDKSLSVEK
jgi:hypothetical protein